MTKLSKYLFEDIVEELKTNKKYLTINGQINGQINRQINGQIDFLINVKIFGQMEELQDKVLKGDIICLSLPRFRNNP